MSIFPAIAFGTFAVILGYWIGINAGIGLAMSHGPEEACNMLRWSILICK